MIAFDSYTPTRLIMSKSAETKAGDLIKEYLGKKVLVHYGSGSVIKSGLLQRVFDSLKQAELEWIELGGVVPNPRAKLVYEGIKICKENHIDFILAVGGGSVLDSAKAIAMGSCYEGDFWDFYKGAVKPEKRLKIGTIITLPATGSEASNSSVIKNDELNIKRGVRNDLNRPDFSLINPELTYTLTSWQIACGGADIISHVLERYFTRTSNVNLSDKLCESVVKTVIEEIPKALENPAQYDVQANIFWSSTIAHIGWLGMGRQEDWSVHALEHELSGHYDTAHGAGLAALYPAWMQYILEKDKTTERFFCNFSKNVFDIKDIGQTPAEIASKGITELSKTFKSWGLPANLEELGIPKNDLEKLVPQVKRQPDGTTGYFHPLNDDDLINIYNLAWDWK